LQTLLGSLALLAIPLFPAIRGELGIVSLAGTLVLSGVFLFYSARFAIEMSMVSARRLLFASILYLPLLLAFFVLDKR
jgi:protoheme IX farnesyltransferase